MTEENNQKLHTLGFLLRDILKNNAEVNFNTDAELIPLLPDINNLFDKLVDQGYINSGKNRYKVTVGNIQAHMNLLVRRKINQPVDDNDAKICMHKIHQEMMKECGYESVSSEDDEYVFTEDILGSNVPNEVESVFQTNTAFTITVNIDAYDENQAKRYAWNKISDHLYEYIDQMIDSEKTYKIEEIPHDN